VPRISTFYGIVITMYYRDHDPPHFHAVYGEGPCPRAPRYHFTTAMNAQTARIISAEPLQGFVLKLSFEDGTERTVDLEGELWGPVFEPLRANPDLFRQVGVDRELGTIVWPNGADMDPDVLHGDFEAAEAAPTARTSRARP